MSHGEKLYKVTLYRNNGLTPVVYDNVEHVYWNAGNTVLSVRVQVGEGDKKCFHWLREQLAWYSSE